MSGKDGGYRLPEIINPTGRRYVCVPVPDELNHILAFLGQLDELASWWAWERDDAKQGRLAARIWKDIAEDVRFVLNTSDNCAAGGGCLDYGPESIYMTYEPNSPYLTPELTPTGYALPPWYINPETPIPGVLPGDAMVNGASLPVFASLPDLLASGFPRFRVTIPEGTTECEIEFVRIPQGGIAFITMDGDPLTAITVDLNVINPGNLFSLETLLSVVLTRDLTATFVYEKKITDGLAHYLDVTFFPNAGEGIILGFGGGVRRVTLCGGIPEMSEDCCKTYKFVGGVLYESIDAGETWSRVDDGGNGPWDDEPSLPPLPGSDGSDKTCQAAWNAARVYQAFHIQLSPYFVLGALAALAISSVATGFVFLLGGGPLGYAAVSGVVTAALAFIGGGLVADDFDAVHVEALACIFIDHLGSDGTASEAEFAAIIAALNAKSGLIWQATALYVDGMGRAGLNNAARTNAEANPDCSCGEWCYEWDFTVSNGGWLNVGTTNGDNASWVMGSGWHGGGRGSPYDGIVIRVQMPAIATIMKVEVYFTEQLSGANPIVSIGPSTSFGWGSENPVAHNPVTFIQGGSGWVDNDLYVTANRAQGASFQQLITNYITKVRVQGTGLNPYGSDNCSPSF